MAVTSQFVAGQILTADDLNRSSIPIVSSTSDITSPFTGQLVFNTTGNTLHRYTGSTWTLYDPNTQWLFKTSNESVTSSTTLQNDDTFAFTVLASARYALEGYCVYQGATDTAGGLKADFTVPSGASFEWTNFGANTSGTSQYNVTTQGASVARDMPTLPPPSPPGMSFQPKGWLLVAATPGTLQFRWAQQTSNATATIVRAGSWMKLTRIA